MKYQYASYTDIGKRGNNEDSLGLQRRKNSLLAVVADGLGGHANGEVASRIAVDTILRELRDKPVDEEELACAMLKASEEICGARISGHTTAAALWLEEDYAVAAHVGDSRIYQFREGKIIFQSLDHSAVQMAVLVGELEPEAVRHHKDRNKIFRVLGEEDEPPRVDSTELTVKPGDRFLLCSDGFWEPVTEEAMLQTLGQKETPESWLEAMKGIVEDAQDPKQDNNTAVCIFV